MMVLYILDMYIIMSLGDGMIIDIYDFKNIRARKKLQNLY